MDNSDSCSQLNDWRQIRFEQDVSQKNPFVVWFSLKQI